MGAHRRHARYCPSGDQILSVSETTLEIDGMLTFSERSCRTVLVVFVLMLLIIVGKWSRFVFIYRVCRCVR